MRRESYQPIFWSVRRAQYVKGSRNGSGSVYGAEWVWSKRQACCRCELEGMVGEKGGEVYEAKL